jgi:selenocysteine lyase/cysteine desulfurase
MLTDAEVADFRRETPGCARTLHFNNAGAALPPQLVVNTVKAHLDLEAEIGGYEAADATREGRARTYESIARLINATAGEIALVENATRAWDMAFYSLTFTPGDRIVTSTAEYGSNYIAYLQVARKTGAVIEVLPNDEHGQVSLDALRASLARGRVGLVGITHVPTNGGLVNPAEEIGSLTRAAGVPYLLDACQSAGQWPLDVEAIGCDMLSVTGRKFLRGPRGTGFLYVRRSMIASMEPPVLDIEAAQWSARDAFTIEPTAKRFENWESYIAGFLGLGVAVEYAQQIGLERIRARVVSLAERLRSRLAEVPGVVVRDLGRRKCGICTFTTGSVAAEVVRDRLRARRINVSVLTKASARLDLESRGLDTMVRASVHYYNTEAEIEQFVDALLEVLSAANGVESHPL